MEVKLTIEGTKGTLFNIWTFAIAEVGGAKYDIQMVRFDNPSKYGIRGGRISKLWARGGERRDVCMDYDRGWSLRPKTSEARAVLAEILKQYN